MATYDPRVNRYRDSNGRFISRERVLNAVQSSIDHSSNKAAALVQNYKDGNINILDFEKLARQEIKKAYIREGILGKGGGRDNMTSRDWSSIGGMLKEQYGYLHSFANDIHANDYTQGQIETRLQMYFKSSREAYERMNMSSFGVPALPAQPGDGSTICLTNCNCRWHITRVYSPDGRTLLGFKCKWELGKVKNCPTCLARSVAWKELFIEAGKMPTFTREESLYRSAYHDILQKELELH